MLNLVGKIMIGVGAVIVGGITAKSTVLAISDAKFSAEMEKEVGEIMKVTDRDNHISTRLDLAYAKSLEYDNPSKAYAKMYELIMNRLRY